MPPRLHPRTTGPLLRVALSALSLLIGWLPVYSQCLPAAGCQPGNAPAANLSFGMGIYRVTLAGLDTATTGAADGYQDYGCRARAARLVRGTSYTLQVRTNANANETVRAWLDYDRDGQFTAAELVLSSNAARQHAATFTVPVTAPTGVPLRLRVAADYSNAPVPTSCSTPQYSQTEDYRVLVLATAPPRPQARFVALDTISCGAAVRFRDQSLNAPSDWRWDFGDGSTSTQQHPQHLYAAAGTYAVKLRACNAAGCDSLTRTGYVVVRADAPRPAPCAPAATAYCCGFGPTRVRLAGIDQRSADGQAGYQDFSCAQRTPLTLDQPYLLQLTTGAVAHDVRVYLDLTDDGQFTAPAELLYQGLSVQSPDIPLLLPASLPGLVLNRPLRLRLWTDFAGSPAVGACAAPQRGQVEDYSVVLQANAAPPTAAFALRYQQGCGPVRVALTNQSSGGVTSYQWDFGDGTTSTLASPPAHTYTRPGTYEVRLIAQNTFGQDTAWRMLAVAEACPTYCTPLGNGATASAPMYFTRVRVADLDNIVPRNTGIPYFDFTDMTVELRAGQQYNYQSESLPWSFSGSPPWVRATLWLDLNQDGFFTPNEIMGSSTLNILVNNIVHHGFPMRVPASAKVGVTRMRVSIQTASTTSYVDPSSCTPAYHYGSAEDYLALILPPAAPPRALFTAELRRSCSGTVQFRDSSYAGPTSWRWDFGDGTSSTQQHPRHVYAAPGTYTVGLTVRNRFGSDSLRQTGFVTVSSLASGPQPAGCLPPAGNTEGTRGIGTFTVGAGWSYAQPANATGYRDETCAHPPLTLLRGASYPMTLANRYGSGSPPIFFWLDLNEDGRFDQAGELIFNTLALPYVSGVPRQATLTLPPNTPLNRPLRLRVMFADYGYPVSLTAPPNVCYRTIGDQVRDFTLIATSTTATTLPTEPTWQVYPNPTDGFVTVRGQFRQPTSVELRDALGRTVYQQLVLPAADHSLPVDLRAVPRGVYLLRVGQEPRAVRLARE